MKQLLTRVFCSLTLFACGTDTPAPKQQLRVGSYCSTLDKACREASAELYAGTCTVTIIITPQAGPQEKTKRIVHTFKYFTASDTKADHSADVILADGTRVVVDFDYKDRPSLVARGRTSWMRFDDRESEERFRVVDKFMGELNKVHPPEVDPRSLLTHCWPDAVTDDKNLRDSLKSDK